MMGICCGKWLEVLINAMLTDPEILANTKAIGERLRAEDGTLNAAKAIKRAATTFEYPWPTKRK